MVLEYETERLVLKVLKPEAAAMVLDFYKRDQELFERYEPDRMENFYTVGFQANMLRAEYNLAIKQQTVRFYVFRKENLKEIIGTVCLHDISFFYYKDAEIGYKFSSAYHKQGFAREALRECIRIAYEEMGLHRLEAWVFPDNQASIHLLEKLDFAFEGRCRANLLLHGRWEDHLQYSLINPRD